MIKTVGNSPDTTDAQSTWLDPDAIGAVSVSSEDPAYPIEDALRGIAAGWRAATPGIQRIVLRFRAPTAVHRMRLVFEERSRARTQEFALDWRAGIAGPLHNGVRQQFTFAPPGTEVQTEDYATDLRDVTVIELTIRPDVGDPTAMATLKEWRIGGEEASGTRE